MKKMLRECDPLFNVAITSPGMAVAIHVVALSVC
jgi:hypothetical protein